jgi:hypothetical protein
MTRTRWPFNADDCLIEVTAWTGLTVFVSFFSITSYILVIFTPFNVLRTDTQKYLSTRIKITAQIHVSEELFYTNHMLWMKTIAEDSSHLYYAVICIERSSCSCHVIENFIWIEPPFRGHFSYKATFSLSQRFDCTVINASYIPSRDKKTWSRTVFHYEDWYKRPSK